MLTSFLCTCLPSLSPLETCLFRSSAHFFEWVVLLILLFTEWVLLILNYVNYLYILKINPLSVASFANIFSHFVGCLFILFMISFAVQKLLSLIKSHLFLFLFHYFRRWIQKNAAAIYVKECSAYVFL